MIIKASQRGGARNLANHLMNTNDNDHVTLHQIRGLAGQSLHAALLEIDAVSKGTRCQQPLFSVSFNPPETAIVDFASFEAAFDKLESKLGLDGQPRAIVFHEKEGRRHAHVVWSRIDIGEMKAIRMSHFKQKCKDISRDLYLHHGWDMPKGLQKAQDRDPFDLSNAEWQQCKRKGIDPRDVKALCQSAWSRSDNRESFQRALEDKGLLLCRGDRRGFVVMDHEQNIFSLSRYGGLKTKELKQRLGNPETLPSVTQAKQVIRSTYNADALERIRELKEQHKEQLHPLIEQKTHMIQVQRAERRELMDQQRVKRNINKHEANNRYRRGIRGFFDKVSGRHKRITLINRKGAKLLKEQQKESRELMIFRHNQERAELQKQLKAMRQEHRNERTNLAKRIQWFKKSVDHERDTQQKSTLQRDFDRSINRQNGKTRNSGAKNIMSRKRTLE